MSLRDGTAAATQRHTDRSRSGGPARDPRRRPQALCLLLGAAALAGCAQTRQFEPTVDPAALSDTQFIHYLGTVPLVTFAEGCRAMIIAADGHDDHASHEERYAELRRRGIVRDAWHIDPDHVLDRGALAFMVIKVCQLPLSVNSLLLGSWGPGDRRYALRQAVDHELLAYGPPSKLVTGGEMLLTLAHVDAYMAQAGLYDAGTEDIDSPAQATARE